MDSSFRQNVPSAVLKSREFQRSGWKLFFAENGDMVRLIYDFAASMARG